MRTLPKIVVMAALAAGAAMGSAAVPAPAPGPGAPAASAPSGQMPVAERFAEGRAAGSADEAARRDELARDCNEQARAQRLMGDDRRVFMVRCMHR